MKLKNKKTGEIIEFDAILPVKDVVGDSVAHLEYGSLAGLNEEWCDYEEPKVYYYISDFGAIRECEIGKFPEDEEDRKRIGNYFETKEEAEKTVERLRAWKRLKDKGFRFTDYDYTTYDGKGCGQVFFNGVNSNIDDTKSDLDLLYHFGGEE